MTGFARFLLRENAVKDLPHEPPASEKVMSYRTIVMDRLRERGWMLEIYVQHGMIGKRPKHLYVVEARHPAIPGTYIVSADLVLASFFELELITLSIKIE